MLVSKYRIKTRGGLALRLAALFHMPIAIDSIVLKAVCQNTLVTHKVAVCRVSIDCWK